VGVGGGLAEWRVGAWVWPGGLGLEPCGLGYLPTRWAAISYLPISDIRGDPRVKYNTRGGLVPAWKSSNASDA
jgi:hypothetical protein